MSPYDVVMLLCFLIRSVVFIVIFRDDFSAFCQSFIVVVVREGVTVRNLKRIRIRSSDARILLKNARGAREKQAWPKAIAWPPRGEAVGPVARPALWSRGPHVPPHGDWVTWPLSIGSILPSFKSSPFPHIH